ncbi:hypothetical protein CXB51_008116 [Gossypium anomalum]|uniref:Zinc knuckle CX2CX4HX4C domain-containing protein n=1 Tax=Gossypium anomalum TaxID=47600 RepID=A0A8J6D7S0_9ROSI|nr:hypothetical protein CXB51_008116 [Gossypium anomalum]
MANIWHPLESVQISNLAEKHFLFKFFNELDINWVITGTLWTFNNHLLIFYRIQENEDPMSILLVYSDWWVHIHDLPPGFFRDSMAVQFKNFIGKYMEYNVKQLSNGYKNYLCIRVQIDVRKPPKRRKKIMISDSNFTYKKFKYEKLTLFCFLCGCLGHGDNFCLMRLQHEGSNFTDALNGLQQKQESRHNGGKDLVPNKSQQLGTSLNGDELRKVLAGVGPANRLDLTSMECKSEDDPIVNEKGKKRQRFDSLISNISTVQDSLEIISGHSAYLQ